MNIAIVTPGFPADISDTTCLTYLQHWTRAMAEKIGKENLVIFSLHYPYSKKEYTWNGIRVIPLGGRNRKGIFRFFLWSRFMSKFKELHEEKPFTRVQSFFLNETAVLAGRTGLPFFVTGMGQEVLTSSPYHRLLAWNKGKFIAISPDMNASMKRRFSMYGFSNKNVRVIPFGVPPRAAAEEKRRDIDILGCGSLTPVKNFTRFIHIVSAVRKSHPALICKIAGSGPEMDALKEEAEKTGLDKGIEFCGEIPQQQLMDMMERTRIFLHTAKSEGQGLVMGEALTHGCFVCTSVASAYAGNENVYKFNSDQEAVDHLNHILSNPGLSCSASVLPTPGEVADQYLNFYEQNV